MSLPFFGELAVEVENALADAGYRILICNSMGRADREREYLSLLVGNRVDGIISGAHNEGLGEYDTIRMPLVTIDRELSPSIPNVRCANEEAGAMATRALIEGGCRYPLLLTSRSGPRNLREAGYRAEVTRSRLTPRVVTVPFDTPTPQRFAMVRDALDEARAAAPIDGVFATDDLAAAEVLEWARTRELSVPADLSIIGFDGTETMRSAPPCNNPPTHRGDRAGGGDDPPRSDRGQGAASLIRRGWGTPRPDGRVPGDADSGALDQRLSASRGARP